MCFPEVMLIITYYCGSIPLWFGLLGFSPTTLVIINYIQNLHSSSISQKSIKAVPFIAESPNSSTNNVHNSVFFIQTFADQNKLLWDRLCHCTLGSSNKTHIRVIHIPEDKVI